MKIGKSFTFYIVLSLVAILLLSLLTGQGSSNDLTYSSFVAMLDTENPADCPIASVELKEGTAVVKLKADYGEFKKDREYKMYYDSTDSIHRLLDTFKQAQLDAGVKDSDGIQYKIVTTSTFLVLLINFLPFLLVIAGVVLVWYFMMNQTNNSNNKAMSFGKSRAKLATDSKRKVTFQDVAGAAEEKEELVELVEFLKDPGKYSALGARIPKGVLLVGPPGTGKTLLARAVAGEAGVPFFTISGSDFVEMYVGVGASRVRDLFMQAKRNAPCIVFIDEIDAVGRHRGAGLGGGHDEREQTLNQLLVEMDGFQMNDGVIIIAATNRKDILDPALLRPGRFDRQVYVNLPDVKEREAILKVHARNKPLTDEVHLDEIAKTTPGFSGADLENLLNESALIAARKGKKTINMDDVKEATFKVIMGPEKKSKVISDKDKKWTAYHEAGHALAVRFKSTVNKVDRVSIIPAGSAGGYTSYRPDEDSPYRNKTEMLQSIVVALGGKAAEELVFNDCSNGTVSDLNHANKVARNMVTKLGMSTKVGNVILTDENDSVFVGLEYGHSKNYSEDLKSDVDAEVKEILDTCYADCRALLEEHIDLLHRVAEILVMKERIEGDEFEAIIDGTWEEKFGPDAQKPEEKEPVAEVQPETEVKESDGEVGH